MYFGFYNSYMDPQRIKFKKLNLKSFILLYQM